MLTKSFQTLNFDETHGVDTTKNYEISNYGYGKDSVKILHVSRNGPVHTIKELEVGTKLKLYSQKDYLYGDNTDIVATDSQKNTVYLLAKKFGVKSPEDFGILLSQHFLEKYKHVKEVAVHIEEYPWKRMDIGEGQHKQAHNHAFVFTPKTTRYCDVTQARTGEFINDVKGETENA
jgi:urate oxidase